MLLSLHIKNMALIEEIEVNFENQLNILTGETGAGKSIILGAIDIALGGKTGKELVRAGAEYGLIELLFLIDKEQTLQSLKRLEIPITEDCQLLISRKIYANRVVNRMNDETITVSKLKEVASILLDVHSQHEHQSLLQKHTHLDILDRFGGEKLEELKRKVEQDYNAYSFDSKRFEDGKLDEEERIRQIDFLQYEINEIQNANLQVHEDELLEKQYRKMVNSRQIAEGIGQIYQITEDNSHIGLRESLGRAVKELNMIAALDSDLETLATQLNTIEELIADFNRELSSYQQELQYDEQEFREIESRLDLINNLKAKYGNSIDTISAYKLENEKQYDKLLDYEENQKELWRLVESEKAKLQISTEQLTNYRKKQAVQLVKQIKEALLDLNFLNVKFDMKFETMNHFTRHGVDEAYFIISTNVGEQEKPLWEVASGGELSRIMLAIKSCFASQDSIDTLIFDEIDVGISGRTAQMVAQKLAMIAKEHQVISITHLPQIAAMADAHYVIEKNIIADKTITSIHYLTKQESINEIARLIGGVEITNTVLRSAQEMKDMASCTKLY